MLLSEFINKTEAVKDKDEWMVSIPLFDGTIGRLYIKNVNTPFEAKETAYNYLNEFFEKKRSEK